MRRGLPGGRNLTQPRPHPLASALPEGRAALRRAKVFHKEVRTEALLAGRSPANEAEVRAGRADGPWRLPGDLELIGDPLDLLGVNLYRP